MGTIRTSLSSARTVSPRAEMSIRTGDWLIYKTGCVCECWSWTPPTCDAVPRGVWALPSQVSILRRSFASHGLDLSLLSPWNCFPHRYTYISTLIAGRYKERTVRRGTRCRDASSEYNLLQRLQIRLQIGNINRCLVFLQQSADGFPPCSRVD